MAAELHSGAAHSVHVADHDSLAVPQENVAHALDPDAEPFVYLGIGCKLEDFYSTTRELYSETELEEIGEQVLHIIIHADDAVALE